MSIRPRINGFGFSSVSNQNSHGRKAMRACDSASDMISNLPNNIINNILTCLPIRDAARTCVLSKIWRFKWLYLSELVFDEIFSGTSPGNSVLSTNKIWSRIYEILLLHRGPLRKFVISIPELISGSRIYRIILFLSQKDIQECTFSLKPGIYYELPSTLFSCTQLTHLNLSQCEFRRPPEFTGFSNLISVDFNRVDISTLAFRTFLSKCPLLQRLKLDYLSEMDHLDIDAPNLKYLYLSGIFESICFKNTPLLSTLIIKNVEYWSLSGYGYVFDVFDSLPMIEHLVVGYPFLMNLMAGEIPEKLPTTFLKCLELSDLALKYKEVASFALCLIRSFPNLQKLRVKGCPCVDNLEDLTSPESLVKAQEPWEDSLNQLRVVMMDVFCGTWPELEFLKYLLAKSLVLEKIFIQPPPKTEAKTGLKILKDVLRLRRASPRAEIIYLDPMED
ncbi:F-box/FBD/LRR-repeat protein At1g13570-like isoform X2 [Tripterygium wilfordii]|uniref:F-box/FBD/LRR-repeat protein At1g13570-like isoform X2 n=1 Tax=Tripterygium wilfordii TaxID=458696 RepID=UPI0018F8200D|nr:F-box/FBD/LRR-repeat protein At1g13570-like isoform X2 [Tripterygium wilfordii]